MTPSTPGAPFRILFINIVSLNVGDAAILEAEIEAFREAYDGPVEIAVADEEPEAAARVHPHIDFIPGLHLRRVPRVARARGSAKLARSIRRRRVTLAVRLLRRSPSLARRLLGPVECAYLDRAQRADVVISTGGTFYVDHYPVRGRVDELLAAQALGRPTYFYTQSIGPLRDARKRRLVGRVLRGADGVFLRDERSRKTVLGLGVPDDRIRLCPDAAFGFAMPADRTPRRGAPGGRPPRIAISVRRWPHFRTRPADEGTEAYRRAVADAVRRLRALGAEVTFVSTCQGVPEYWTDDSRFARTLVDELLPDVSGVRVDSRFRRPRELMDHLRAFDLAVATRMHFAIFALNVGVPVVPIAYEFKTEELFDGIGMRELVVDIETITSESLVRRIETALESADVLRARVRGAVDALRGGSTAPAEFITRRHAPRTSPADTTAPGTTRTGPDDAIGRRAGAPSASDRDAR
ncbi:MAG: polysaccharide pyruvyl transferase family protein [Gemmatimonadota bacterium]